MNIRILTYMLLGVFLLGCTPQQELGYSTKDLMLSIEKVQAQGEKVAEATTKLSDIKAQEISKGQAQVKAQSLANEKNPEGLPKVQVKDSLDYATSVLPQPTINDERQAVERVNLTLQGQRDAALQLYEKANNEKIELQSQKSAQEQELKLQNSESDKIKNKLELDIYKMEAEHQARVKEMEMKFEQKLKEQEQKHKQDLDRSQVQQTIDKEQMQEKSLVDSCRIIGIPTLIIAVVMLIVAVFGKNLYQAAQSALLGIAGTGVLTYPIFQQYTWFLTTLASLYIQAVVALIVSVVLIIRKIVMQSKQAAQFVETYEGVEQIGDEAQDLWNQLEDKQSTSTKMFIKQYRVDKQKRNQPEVPNQKS